MDCFRLKKVRRVRAQHFFQISAASFPGETVDETADAQLIIWIDILAGIEDFADVQGETGFLISTRKLVEVLCDSAVGYFDPDKGLRVEKVHHEIGGGVQFILGRFFCKCIDDRHLAGGHGNEPDMDGIRKSVF